MADLRAEQESTQLKLQIKFMKDLIDRAKSKKNNPSHKYEKSTSYHGPNSVWTPCISYEKRKAVLPTGLSNGTARKLCTRVTGKVPYGQTKKDIDRTKYSFVRVSSAPVVITPKNIIQKTQNVSSTKSAITAIQPSCSTSGETKNISPKKTPEVSSTLDLNKHSLESLKKILAAKMKAKDAKKAKTTLVQSNFTEKHLVKKSASVKSHNSLRNTLSVNVMSQKQNSNVITSSQACVKTGRLKSAEHLKNVAIISSQHIENSLPSDKKQSTQNSTGLSKMKSETKDAKICDISMKSSQGNIATHLQNSAESFMNLAGQLPSKGELAEGLKNTEAKIKELTAELTKLKQVAQIVSASPRKSSQKATRKPNSSASSHRLRHSSSNFSCVKGGLSRYGRSNTQHAARYVISKYKLKKETHLKTKHKPNGKVNHFKKTLPSFQCKPLARHKQPHKPSAYRWSKPEKQLPLTTQQTSGQSSYLSSCSGISHRRHHYQSVMPFWKRQVLYRGSSSQRLTVWQRENRRAFGSSRVFVSRNLCKSMQRFSAPKGARTFTVNGVKFQIGTTGKTLQRINTEGSSCGGRLPQKTISRVNFRGVTYRETKPGTLEKSSSHQTRIRANQALYKSIAVSTGRHKLKKTNRQYCMFYCRFGKCNRGDNCTYVHDPDQVAVCTRFLRGTCKVENCPFSHKISKEKMPVCSYFLKGGCIRDDCPYRHVNVNRDAKVCRDFVKGFCPRGEKCKEKHILECPEFVRTGKCPEGKKCKLDHRKKPLKRKLPQSQRPAAQKDREPLNQEETSVVPSTDQQEQSQEPVPFKLMKLPAFISIVSDDNEPKPSLETPKPAPAKTHQGQIRIKPRL